MYSSSVLLAVAGATLAAAQGYSTECTDVSLNNAWLIGTCPDGNGNQITSSVFLNNKLSNSDGTLTWTEDGSYRSSCSDCSLTDAATLSCKCSIASSSSAHDTTINLEEHIANYEGHLLSNQTGAITDIPTDSSVAVPSDFAVQIALSTIDDTCASTGVTLSLNDPTDCYYARIGVQPILYTSGITSSNEGWEIVAYEDTDCTTAVATFTVDNDDTCVAFDSTVEAFSSRPLWNADY
ncbi:Cyanovirin-N [Aspergillus venezuelensis]